MTGDGHGGHDAAEDERARLYGLRKLEARDAAVRREETERQQRRLGALIGPGHNHDLAPDAPLGSDPRLDNTGFSPGGVL